MTDQEALEIYEAVFCSTEQYGKDELPELADAIREIVESPTAEDAAKAIEWWGYAEDDIDLSEEIEKITFAVYVRDVRRVRELAAGGGDG